MSELGPESPVDPAAAADVRMAEWRRTQAAWYDELGVTLGAEDEPAAIQAATTIANSWPVDESYGNPARAALERHCGLVHGPAASVIIREAARRMSTPPSPSWIGPDRRIIESGYAMLAPLVASDDYDTSFAVYHFLHTGISGGEPLTGLQKWFTMWATSMEVQTEVVNERSMWQAFRDVDTSRKLTHVTQDSYRALRRIAGRCPHPDIRESALADVADYEALIKDFRRRGVYLEFS